MLPFCLYLTSSNFSQESHSTSRMTTAAPTSYLQTEQEQHQVRSLYGIRIIYFENIEN